jgi:hypothetical protein
VDTNLGRAAIHVGWLPEGPWGDGTFCDSGSIGTGPKNLGRFSSGCYNIPRFLEGHPPPFSWPRTEGERVSNAPEKSFRLAIIHLTSTTGDLSNRISVPGGLLSAQ